MGTNQDLGDYEITIPIGEEQFAVITDIYSSGGIVYCRTTVIGTDFTNSWVEIHTPTYSTGRDEDLAAWMETFYQGQAARTKEWEIQVAANELLTIELFNVASANIGFDEFVMDSNSLAAFNETFNGGFNEVFYQNDASGSFVTHEGAYTTSDTNFSPGFHTAPAYAPDDHVRMLVAAISSINMFTSGLNINLGILGSNGYYYGIFFVHSSLGWIEFNTYSADNNPFPIKALSDCSPVTEPGVWPDTTQYIKVYVSGYTYTPMLPSEFDGVIDGIGWLDVSHTGEWT